jgi:hypothetical protein
LNYALYLQNQEAFLIDRSLQESFVSQIHRERIKNLISSRCTAEIWDDIADRTANLSQNSFTKSRVSYWFGPLKYQLDFPINDAKITLTDVPSITFPNYHSLPVYILDAYVGKEHVTVSSEKCNNLILDLQLLAESDTPIRKDDLVRVLRSAAVWERTNWVKPLEQDIESEKKGVTLPLSLFLYQGMMDAMGSSPKHFVPANGITRGIALCSAFIKFAFFGLLLSLLSKHWAQATTTSTK